MAGSVSFTKIFRAFEDARADGNDVPRLCVVGTGVERTHVVAALLRGAAPFAKGLVSALRPVDVSSSPQSFALWDIVVFVAEDTDGAALEPLVRAARCNGRRVVAVVRGREDDQWLRAAGFDDDEAARSYGPDAKGRATLENRLVHAADHRAAALAFSLPAVRLAYCDHVILTNATQNGIIGVVVIIPGADMPAMTANQIRMVLQIAAAYGEEVGLDRAIEILSVVGAGFAFRALARQALSFVPGFGWAIKGAVGVSATLALGRAAVAYFEAGAPLQVSHMRRVQHQVDRVRNRLPDLLHRSRPGT